jgi:hypothetical protein
MHFQQPGFLWGLLLILLPILIHLFQFRKFKTLYFPGVFRLVEQLNASKKQKMIKHWWLLITRCLAIFFLVLSFSMPSCNEQQQVTTLENKIVVVIDCSPSMMLQNNGEVLLEKAKNAGRKIIKNANANTKFAIIANHSQMSQQWLDSRAALNVISEIQANQIPESLQDWMKNIDPLIASNEGSNLFVYLVTDAKHDVFEGYKNINYTNAIWKVVEIESTDPINFSIDSAYITSPWNTHSKSQTITAQISCSQSDYVGSLNVQLISDDKIIGNSKADFNKQNKLEVNFSLPNGSLNKLKLSLDDNSIQADNSLLLYLNTSEEFPLVVSGNNPFVNKLLKTQSIFQVKPFGGFEKINSEVKTVVICNAENINAKTLVSISELTQKGVNVVCIPQTKNINANDFFGLKVILKKDKYALAASGLNNDVFKSAFTETIDEKTQMPFVTEYFQIEKQVDPNWQTILTLENNDPILLKKESGNGSIWLWMSDFESGSLSFAKSSLFLPLFTQLFMGSFHEAKPILGFLNSSNPMPISHVKEFNIEKGAVLRSEQSEWVANLEMSEFGLAFNTQFQTNKPGYYDLCPSKENNFRETVALNSLRTESELKSISLERKNEMQQLGVKFVEEQQMLNKLTIIQADNSLWRLFLWLSALFFAGEVVLLVLKYKNKQTNSVKTV